MMIEINNGFIQMDPHTINGIYQNASNGFDKWWSGWDDINTMLELAKQYVGKTKDCQKVIFKNTNFLIANPYSLKWAYLRQVIKG